MIEYTIPIADKIPTTILIAVSAWDIQLAIPVDEESANSAFPAFDSTDISIPLFMIVLCEKDHQCFVSDIYKGLSRSADKSKVTLPISFPPEAAS